MAPSVNATEKHLFPAGLQKGREYVEIFSSSGSDPTSWWHISQNQKSKVTRHFCQELRSYYISIGADCALPRAPQALHLLQSNLVFQVLMPGISQGFRANIICTTIEGNTRSIFISSLLKAPLLNNLQRKCLPIEIVSDKWINIVINLHDLISYYFKERFSSLDRVELQPSMRIRRAFTQRVMPPAEDDPIHEDMRLPAECEAFTVILDSSSVPDKTAGKVPVKRIVREQKEELVEGDAGRRWKDEADPYGSEEEFPVIGQGLVLTAEERKRLDEAIEDVDETSSVDSDTWNLLPHKKAGAPPKGGLDLYSENTRLLAAKRRGDAKFRVVEHAVERLKSSMELPEVEEARAKMMIAQKRATSAETALEDTWTELCTERGKVRELDEELKAERGVCVGYRIQVRKLQALLRRLDEHANNLSRELQLRDRAQGPVMAKAAAEKRALEDSVEHLEEALAGEKDSLKALRESIDERGGDVHRLESELARAAERVEAQERLRMAERDEHAAAARSWAREMSASASHTRRLEGRIAELTLKEAEGLKARKEHEGIAMLLALREGELEELRAGAGTVERQNVMLRDELERARQSVMRAHIEREAEGERLHRDQVQQFARMESRHTNEVLRLRERTERAEKLFRKEWVRRKDQGRAGAWEGSEVMSVDSLGNVG